MTASVVGLPREPALVSSNRRLREALERVTRAAGGDPCRPDWDPADAADLVEAMLGDPADLRVETAERRAIVRALAATNGNRRQAARALGIGKTTLYRKIDQFNLDDHGT